MGEDAQGGATVNVTVKTQSYPSLEAVTAELAMRLFANGNFDMGKSAYQMAKDAVARAKEFTSVAGGLMSALVAEK